MGDAAGYSDRYTYDRDHRLTSFTDKNGLRFHYRYDDKGRCVESWGAFEKGLDPAISPRVPKLLGDGSTPVKGIHHVRLRYYEEGYTRGTPRSPTARASCVTSATSSA